LTQGWYGFRFINPKDTIPILENLWVLDGNSVMLKRWRVNFDPAREYFHLQHMWVLLHGLPLQLWNKRALEVIGNELGRFISVDD
jgi:hypothetical protein